MTRSVKAGAAAGLLLMVAAFLVASPAYAVSPSQVGWWTSVALGEDLVPVTTLFDVPATDLLLTGGVQSTNGPTDTGAVAYSALVYRVPAGSAPTTLTLQVAPNSGSTSKTVLELCPLQTLSIHAEKGGPAKDAPAYSCQTYATASTATGGDTYTFAVAHLITGDELAVAVLPTSVASRVVLTQPGSTSLALTSVSASSSSTAPSGSSSADGSTNSPATTVAQGTNQIPEQTGIGPSDGAPVASVNPVAVSSNPPSSSATANPPSVAALGSSITPTTVASGGQSLPAAFAPSSSGSSSGANPLAVVLLIAALVVGGGAWMAVARSSSQNTEAGSPQPVDPHGLAQP